MHACVRHWGDTPNKNAKRLLTCSRKKRVHCATSKESESPQMNVTVRQIRISRWTTTCVKERVCMNTWTARWSFVDYFSYYHIIGPPHPRNHARRAALVRTLNRRVSTVPTPAVEAVEDCRPVMVVEMAAPPTSCWGDGLCGDECGRVGGGEGDDETNHACRRPEAAAHASIPRPLYTSLLTVAPPPRPRPRRQRRGRRCCG